jgi:predicted DNA-binding protein
MGRPPLNVRETKVRLPEGTRERIVALLGGDRMMAAFIREAVEEVLARREAEAKSAGKRGARPAPR